jgi:hypothetical protein
LSCSLAYIATLVIATTVQHKMQQYIVVAANPQKDDQPASSKNQSSPLIPSNTSQDVVRSTAQSLIKKM